MYSLPRLIQALSNPHGSAAQDCRELAVSDRTSAFYGQWQDRREQDGSALVPTRRMVRTLNTGSASAGGDLSGISVMKAVDSVRPVMLLEKYGAQRIETDNAGLTIPKFVEADAGWIAEGSNAPALATTTTSIDLTPKGAAARLAFSRRLQLLAADVEAQVLGEISRAVAALIERGALQGTGSSSEPLGILNLPERQTQTFAGAVPTVSELAGMIEKVGDQDAALDALAFFLHPSDAAALMTAETASGAGRFVMEYQDGSLRILGLPAAVTTNVAEGKVLLLDPTYVRLAYFGAPQLIVDRFTGAVSGEAKLTVLNYCDVVHLRPETVCVGSA